MGARFLTFANGRTVNLDHAVEILAPYDDNGTGWYVRVVLVDGNAVEGKLHDLAVLDRLNDRYVPATPGYEVVRLWDGGKPDEFIEQAPVVAWRIDECGTASPVALGDSDETRQNLGALVYPDGRVLCDGVCDSLDEWLDGERARQQRVRSA
jgi:hypothetical protein